MTEIRTATENDIPAILRLYEQLSFNPEEGSRQQSPVLESHRQAITDIAALPGCQVIVAEDNGTIIGTTSLMIVPNLSHGALPWAIVENVVVDSEYRKTGMGKLLMDYVKDKAREAGCYKIQLMSDKRRNEAHKFYQAIGYNPTAEGFRMYL